MEATKGTEEPPLAHPRRTNHKLTKSFRPLRNKLQPLVSAGVPEFTADNPTSAAQQALDWVQRLSHRLSGPEMLADLGKELEVGKGVLECGLVGRAVEDAVQEGA